MAADAPKRHGVLPARFFRSATWNYLNSFVALVLAIVITPILVRGLGKEAYGTWTLVTSSVLYYSILQFGLARATVKFVAEEHAAGDMPSARRTIATSFLSLSVPASVLILVSPALAFLFTVIFDLPDGFKTAAMVLVVLSTVDFAIGMPCDTFGAALVALQRYDLLNATATGVALAQAISWAIILAFGGGIVELGIATITFSLIGNLVRYVMVRRLMGGIPIGPRTFERRKVKPLLSMSGWIALSDTVEIVTIRIDPLVVALVAGVPAVAVYTVGQKLSAFVERLTGPALAMFFPHAAALSASGDHEAIRRTLLAGTRLSVGLTLPLALVTSVLAEPALDAWVGEGFDGAAAVVIFLSLTTLVISFSRVGIYILRGLGNVRFPALIGVFEAVVNLGASIVLGHIMGIEGVALGTLIGVTMNHLFVLVPYVCIQLRVSLWEFILTILRAHLIPCAASLAVGFALRSFAYDGIWQLGVAGIATVGTYLVLFSFTGVTGEERRQLAGLVKRKLAGRF